MPILLTLSFICLSFSLHHKPVDATALQSACPAVDNLVPFYLSPSAKLPALSGVPTPNEGSVVLNGPVASCTACDQPQSDYFASAGTPAPFNGAIPAASISPTPGNVAFATFNPTPGNNFALIVKCPGACLCDANGLCAQIASASTNFFLYPLCTSEWAK